MGAVVCGWRRTKNITNFKERKFRNVGCLNIQVSDPSSIKVERRCSLSFLCLVGDSNKSRSTELSRRRFIHGTRKLRVFTGAKRSFFAFKHFFGTGVIYSGIRMPWHYEENKHAKQPILRWFGESKYSLEFFSYDWKVVSGLWYVRFTRGNFFNEFRPRASENLWA